MVALDLCTTSWLSSISGGGECRLSIPLLVVLCVLSVFDGWFLPSPSASLEPSEMIHQTFFVFRGWAVPLDVFSFLGLSSDARSNLRRFLD